MTDGINICGNILDNVVSHFRTLTSEIGNAKASHKNRTVHYIVFQQFFDLIITLAILEIASFFVGVGGGGLTPETFTHVETSSLRRRAAKFDIYWALMAI